MEENSNNRKTHSLTIKELYEYAEKYGLTDAVIVYPYMLSDEDNEHLDVCYESEVSNALYIQHEDGKLTINLNGYNPEKENEIISFYREKNTNIQ